jgi:hypothetical protein
MLPKKKKLPASSGTEKKPARKEAKPKTLSSGNKALAVKRDRKATKPGKPLKAAALKEQGTSSRRSALQKSKRLFHSTVAQSPSPRYGETQVIAFIRDPRCIYTFWEVAPEGVEAVKRQLKEEFKNSSMVLRVFRINPQGESQFLYEIEVAAGSMNRYLEVDGEGQGYFVEITQKTVSGKYFVYARSRNLTLPGSSPSSKIDSQWIPSAGLEEYFEQEVAAPSGVALSSAQGQKSKRQFPHLSSHR